MLTACAWQAGAKIRHHHAIVVVGGHEQLDCIGRVGCSTIESALCEPGISPATLLEILPVHDDRAEGGVVAYMVVDILRGIGFAVHQEAAVAKTDILNENEIG